MNLDNTSLVQRLLRFLLLFTFFHISHISRELVNYDSHITQAQLILNVGFKKNGQKIKFYFIFQIKVLSEHFNFKEFVYIYLLKDI